MALIESATLIYPDVIHYLLVASLQLVLGGFTMVRPSHFPSTRLSRSTFNLLDKNVRTFGKSFVRVSKIDITFDLQSVGIDIPFFDVVYRRHILFLVLLLLLLLA